MAKLDELNRHLLLRQFIEEEDLSPEEATKKLRTYDPSLAKPMRPKPAPLMTSLCPMS